MPTKLKLQKPERVVKQWRVNSRTKTDPITGEPVHYFVKLFESGRINCECPARKGKCWHRAFVEKDYGLQPSIQ